MVRKSGAESGSVETGRPEMTMIGISGCCWRTIRMVSNPSIPGMKISRNNRSKSPVSHRLNPLRPSPAVTTTVAGAFQQQADGHLNRHVVIHDQYSCQGQVLRRRWNTHASCKSCRKLALPQPIPLHGCSIQFAKRSSQKTFHPHGAGQTTARPASQRSKIRADIPANRRAQPRGLVAQIFRIARPDLGKFAERARQMGAQMFLRLVGFAGGNRLCDQPMVLHDILRLAG